MQKKQQGSQSYSDTKAGATAGKDQASKGTGEQRGSQQGQTDQTQRGQQGDGTKGGATADRGKHPANK